MRSGPQGMKELAKGIECNHRDRSFLPLPSPPPQEAEPEFLPGAYFSLSTFRNQQSTMISFGRSKAQKIHFPRFSIRSDFSRRFMSHFFNVRPHNLRPLSTNPSFVAVTLVGCPIQFLFWSFNNNDFSQASACFRSPSERRPQLHMASVAGLLSGRFSLGQALGEMLCRYPMLSTGYIIHV